MSKNGKKTCKTCETLVSIFRVTRMFHTIRKNCGRFIVLMYE